MPKSGPTSHEYRAYGLHVRSAIALPFDSLPQPAEPASAPNVTVRLGAVPQTLPAGAGGAVQGRVWQARPGAFLIEVKDIARYLVTDGKDILVEPLGGDADDVTAFFLGAAFAPLLQQRGVVTLQAAAIEWQAGAVLLLGPSALGKSSLAAALVQRGHALLADDITGVVLDAGGRPLALPAFSRQRLWAQTLNRMNWRSRAGARVRHGLDKYWVEAERHCAELRPVLAAVTLGILGSAEIDIEPLSCGDAFWELSDNTHRKRVLDAMGRTAGHFRTVTALARRVPMLQATRPWRPFLLEALAARVDEQLRALQPTAGRRRPSGTSLGGAGTPPFAQNASSTPMRRLAAKAYSISMRLQPDASGIAWIASYPKSGSTWLRAVLTNYLGEDGAPASINALLGGQTNNREAFDEFLGIESTNMTEAEVERHLPRFREWLAEGHWKARPPFDPSAHGGVPLIVRTHEAHRTAHGAARFPPTGSAVYLVRNPLDIAVSYAHHGNVPIDRAVAWMNSDGSSGSHMPEGAFGFLPELLLTWSGHVSSWVEQVDLSIHVARYEDLLIRPCAGFGAIVRFIGLGEDPARLRQAVERSSFARLQEQEAEFGFIEKQPTAQSFFRAGRAGSWKGALTPEQVRALVDAHGELMARFGYLHEAQSFLGE